VLEFHAAGLDRTAGATGVLLFVSAAERRAVVLADKTVAEHLSPDAWSGVIDELLRGLRRGDLGQGFVDAILHCGKIIAPLVPPRAGKSNELADALIIKD
jgi:putative membrane protein